MITFEDFDDLMFRYMDKFSLNYYYYIINSSIIARYRYDNMTIGLQRNSNKKMYFIRFCHHGHHAFVFLWPKTILKFKSILSKYKHTNKKEAIIDLMDFVSHDYKMNIKYGLK